jgi:UDP-N-acetylmuramoyl-tripeptide--D-alanyl-D-alanine ligase
MKKLAKRVVAAVLGYQVRRLVKKNNLKVIGVAGSIGKTSTKLAIAQVLKAGIKVQYQDGNYNDIVTVPLVFFGESEPSLYNPLAWLGVFWRNQKQISKSYPYDVVVIELGSDTPGQIAGFKRYLRLEIGVITAITPEHMQSFGTIETVADEELEVSKFASLIVANKDLCDPRYLKDLSNLLTYSLSSAADFNISSTGLEVAGISPPEQYSRLAAVAVATKLGLSKEQVSKGLKNVQPTAGRMQMLKGVNDSQIIDDTYNSSPAAAKLALDYLYKMDSPQKIAVLGSMNEMGQYSKEAHDEVGSYCDPKKLDLVMTIGTDAKNYLAPAAEANGCQVQSFDNPYTAAEYLKPIIKKNAIVLVKGSQNSVFAEETVKLILANPDDADKLVRQSDYWTKVKDKCFKQ